MYNPLQVDLPQFEGPLDLLLHLVRKRELDIHDLKLSELTEPYLEWVDNMKERELDVGGEFLVIATTLIWLKSHSLLPNLLRGNQEEEIDAAEMEILLTKRLQVYQEIKEVAMELKELPMLNREIFARAAVVEKLESKERVIEEISLYGLLESFRKVLVQAKAEQPMRFKPDDLKLEDVLNSIWQKLKQERNLSFKQFLLNKPSNFEIVTIFILLLELARLGVLRFFQVIPDDLSCQLVAISEEQEQTIFNHMLGQPLGVTRVLA